MVMELSDPFLKNQYRSTLGITGDILKACMNAGRDGIYVTEISRKANLSHNAVIQNCRRLVKSGLAESIRTKRHHTITITEYGIEFYQALVRFQEIANGYKIRC